MSAEEQQGGAEATEGEASLLDQITTAMPTSVQKDEATDMVRNVVDAAMQGTLTWDKSVTKTIRNAIAAIDTKMSGQLAEVMHNEQFQKLEGSWRGLHHLVMNSETSKTLKLRMLNITKKELFKDLDKAVEFDQSTLFKKIYEEEFGTPGGEPYGS